MFSVTGTVVRGKGAARGIGYPTANLDYASAEVPEVGVWTCRVAVDGAEYHGLAVVGMWELDSGLPSVEVYLLDMAQDLYEKSLTVTPLMKLRDLMQFDSTEALVAQIQQDVADAREVFDL